MGSYDIDALSERMRGWFLEADTDLKAFDKLINEDDEDLRLRSLFHLQQAAEKMGKAVVMLYGIISCEVREVIDEMEKEAREAKSRLPKALRELFEQIDRLCDLGKKAIEDPEGFGRGLRHNLGEIRDMNNKLLDEIFKKPERLKALASTIRGYLQASIPNELLRQLAEQLILKPLESVLEKLREPPRYGDYQCVREVVNHITELDNSLNETRNAARRIFTFRLFLRAFKRRIIKAVRCIIHVKGLTNGLITDVMRIYAGGGFLMLHVVQCLSNFEQKSRYCRAEGKECPPTNDEYLKYYREIAKFLSDLEKSLNRLSKVSVGSQDNNRPFSIDAVIKATLSDPCISEIIKFIGTALPKNQTTNPRSAAQP